MKQLKKLGDDVNGPLGTDQKCLDFSALLCSRLCHDLISPVGAIGNGIEILRDEDDADMREQVVTLLVDSARQTANRLQFFRLAFGAAGGFGERVDPREAQKATENFFAFGKTRLEWSPGERTMPKEVLKLLLNLVLIGQEALIRGGTLTVVVTEDEQGNLLAKVVGEGARYIIGDNVRKALREGLPSNEIEPRSAPSQLAYLIARSLGATLYLDCSIPTSFTIGFSCQPDNS